MLKFLFCCWKLMNLLGMWGIFIWLVTLFLIFSHSFFDIFSIFRLISLLYFALFLHFSQSFLNNQLIFDLNLLELKRIYFLCPILEKNFAIPQRILFFSLEEEFIFLDFWWFSSTNLSIFKLFLSFPSFCYPVFNYFIVIQCIEKFGPIICYLSPQSRGKDWKLFK